MATKPYSGSGGVEAGRPSTKIRAEQVKSEDGFTSLAVDLEALRGQVKDIIGAADYKEEITGEYAKVQIVDLAAHFDASGAAKVVVKQDAEITGAADLKSTLAVAGKADFAGIVDVAMTLSASAIKIDGDNTAGRLYIVGAEGQIEDEAALTFDGSEFAVTGDLDVSGAAVLGSATVSNLTQYQVVVPGAAGELEGSASLTFDGSELYVNGALDVSGNADIGGNLTVQGDFIVEGSTVTQNVGTVTTEDSLITLNKNGVSIPAAGAGFEFEVGGSIAGYVKTNGSGDLLMKAASGSELTLDVGGAYEIAVDGNLTVEAASFVNQDLTTDAMPEFTKAKLSTLTASRLMASNADKETVSADLSAWVAGTANQISVADDLDGSITLSLEQDIDIAADVEFASLVLSDLTANRMVKTDAASGLLVSADIMDFVTGTLNQVELTAGAFGNVVLSLPQDIHSGASPEFAALTLGAYGDFLADGSNLKIMTGGELVLSGADGQYALAEAGDRATFVSGFGASETIIGAINVLKATASAASKKALYTVTGAAVAAGTNIVSSVTWPAGAASPGFLGELNGQNSLVFVNGMLMQSGGLDYTLNAAGGSLTFAFELQIGDVVVIQKA